MELSTLSPGAGARTGRRRIGRGNASGWGQTSGRGHKGQGARAGCSIRRGFEGGQMPLYRRLPKFGFRSYGHFTGLNRYQQIHISVLERFADGSEVTPESLRAMGYRLPARCRAGYKVLGGGKLTKKLTVKVQAVSKGAQALIEGAGGTVVPLESGSSSSPESPE